MPLKLWRHFGYLTILNFRLVCTPKSKSTKFPGSPNRLCCWNVGDYESEHFFKSTSLQVQLAHRMKQKYPQVVENTFTLPKTKMAPENGWLEDYFPFGFRPIFRGYVSFREAMFSDKIPTIGFLYPKNHVTMWPQNSNIFPGPKSIQKHPLQKRFKLTHPSIGGCSFWTLLRVRWC